MNTHQILNRAFTMVNNLVKADRVSNTANADLGILSTLKLMDDRINHFGPTPHVPVMYKAEDGNWHCGWVPQHVWENLLKPMLR